MKEYYNDLEKVLLKSLISKNEVHEVLGTALEVLKEQLNLTSGAVFLFNPSIDKLKLESQFGLSPLFLSRIVEEGIDKIRYKEFSLFPPNDQIFIQHRVDFSEILRNIPDENTLRCKFVILSLKIGSKKKGYLWLIKEEPCQFSVEEIGSLIEASETISSLTGKAQVHQELLKHVMQLEKLINAQNSILMDLDLDGVLSRILVETKIIFDPDFVEIVICGENYFKLISLDEKMVQIANDTNEYLQLNSIIDILNERRDVIILEHINTEKSKILYKPLLSLESGILLPIIISRKVEGFCIIGKNESGFFQMEEFPLYTTFKVLTSHAFHIAKLHQNLLKLENQLLQASKMESIGILAGGIAHDFNNALTGIIGSADILESMEMNDQNSLKFIKLIRNSSYKMANWTKQLIAYARGGNYQIITMNLNDVIIKAIEIVKGGFIDKISIHTYLNPDLKLIKADFDQMEQVIANILLNSNEAIEEEGEIKIITANLSIDNSLYKKYKLDENKEYVRISIVDNGQGMDEKILGKVYEPFFTTKFQGRGLGLSAVFGIVENHGGKISIKSKINSGTTVEIFLPAIENISS